MRDPGITPFALALMSQVVRVKLEEWTAPLRRHDQFLSPESVLSPCCVESLFRRLRREKDEDDSDPDPIAALLPENCENCLCVRARHGDALKAMTGGPRLPEVLGHRLSEGRTGVSVLSES